MIQGFALRVRSMIIPENSFSRLHSRGIKKDNHAPGAVVWKLPTYAFLDCLVGVISSCGLRGTPSPFTIYTYTDTKSKDEP